MASLTAKIINGKTYYYARECRRVDGKPKIVRTTYLGTLDKIVAAVEGAKEPPTHQSVDIAAFGDVVALFDMAEQIGLVPLINRHVPKGRRQGLTSGQYLLLAAINHGAHPTSKARFADWYRQTALPKLIPATARQLSSQSFWNHMDYFQEQHIEAIQRELSQKLIQHFGLSLRTLTYDGTNFFTYINTRNPAELPKRGRNKQKRNDLRQVSLGMLVSTDFHVPLFHKVYEGNVNDSTMCIRNEQDFSHRRADEKSLLDEALRRGCREPAVDVRSGEARGGVVGDCVGRREGVFGRDGRREVRPPARGCLKSEVGLAGIVGCQRLTRLPPSGFRGCDSIPMRDVFGWGARKPALVLLAT